MVLWNFVDKITNISEQTTPSLEKNRLREIYIFKKTVEDTTFRPTLKQ